MKTIMVLAMIGLLWGNGGRFAADSVSRIDTAMETTVHDETTAVAADRIGTALAAVATIVDDVMTRFVAVSVPYHQQVEPPEEKGHAIVTGIAVPDPEEQQEYLEYYSDSR